MRTRHEQKDNFSVKFFPDLSKFSLNFVKMNGCQRKKTRRIPTNKERGACLARGYQISETYLGGGAMGRVFLAQPTIDVIERNMKLQLFAEQKKKLQVF